MIMPERMKKLEMYVLKRDIDDVLRYLGCKACIQLILDKEKANQEQNESLEMKQKLEALAAFMEIDHHKLTEAAIPEAGIKIQKQKVIELGGKIIEKAGEITERGDWLNQKYNNLVQTHEELKAFSRLNVPFNELENLTFLTVKLGKVPEKNIEKLAKSIEKRAVIIALDEPGLILALSTRKGRWALDTELKKFQFQEVKPPEGLKGLPSETFSRLSKEIKEALRELKVLDKQKKAFNKRNERAVINMLVQLRQIAAVNEIKRRLKSTENVYVVNGWAPKREIKEIISGLDDLTEGRIAVRIFDPEELPGVKSGKEKVPVKLKNSRLIQAFENMVLAYGVPLYGTINPVPFVAIFFILLFALMFGDVGQGAVILITGIIISMGRLKSLRAVKKFGIIFISVGLASMITGFLYGSVFTNEQALVPVTRQITALLFGAPQDRFIYILPTYGIDRIVSFFVFILAVGAAMNSIGILINIINQIKLKRYYHALLSKTGMAGAFFFWYIIFFTVRVVLYGRVYVYDSLFLILPLFLLFLREPLHNLILKKRPILSHGLLAFFMEGIVEILESVSYYISNTISFLRVGAFALSHAILSLIVIELSNVIINAPAGPILSFIFMIAGNAVILLLEGLIVAIQVVRLEYYEFFSKFFTDVGVEFKPFILK